MEWTNELWIMVIGGESDDERMIAKTNNMIKMRDVIKEHNDEVSRDTDKYFELLMNNESRDFYSIDDFDEWLSSMSMGQYVGMMLGL